MVERDRLAQGSEPDPVLDTGSCDPCDRLARKWHRRKAAFDSLGKGREVSNTDSAAVCPPRQDRHLCHGRRDYRIAWL